MNQIFQGKRIYLRELIYSDVTKEYIEWFKEDIVTQFLEAKNLTKEEVLEYIKVGKETKSYHMYAICDIENDKHIGNLKIGPINYKHKISDLVVVIGDKNYWGKGIATEVIKIGNKIAFEVYDIRKLTGGMYSENIGSIKCYIKADWVIEARLRGHYILDGKVIDRVCVSCFNPKYFNSY